MNWSQEEEEEYELTLSRFEAMLKTNKVFFFDSEEFENIILYYLDTGKTNLAKKALKLGLDQHPKSTGLKLVQVEILIYEDKLDEAEKMLNELYFVEPTNEEIYIQKATIYSKRGNHHRAVEFLETALEYTDDYADVYSLIGREYIIMDNLEKAKEYFIKCLEEDRCNGSSLFNVVYCFDFLEQHEQAVAFLNKLVDRNPYNEMIWHQLGKQYFKLKEYELALRAYDYATIIDDTFIGAYTEKARSLQYLKRYDQAIESYNTALEVDQEPCAYVLFKLGSCYEELKDNKSAIKYYKKAVVTDPLFDAGWLAIVDLYHKEGNIEVALKYLSEALDIDDENFEYWKRHANLHYASGNYSQALTGYQKVIIYGVMDIEFYLLFADLCLSFGEFEKAVEALESVYEICVGNAQVEYRLAGFFYMLEDSTKAQTYLKNALTSDLEELTFFSEMFPEVYKSKSVQKIIKQYFPKA